MRLRLEADGGSRGNPGLAGAGSSIVDPASAIAGDRTELACQWEYIAKATNNVAEYHGVVNGLTLAKTVAERAGRAASETTVDVFLDSKLIVEQMSGRWKIKHPDMKPLAQQAKELEREFASVNYTWVPRAQNKRADELANRAMDDKESGIYFAEPEEQDETPAQASGDEVVGEEVGVEKEENTKETSSDWHGGTRPARFLLLRHGETEMSVSKQFSGLSDPALTAKGQWQARRAAEYVGARGNIAAVLSSPLGRAQQTARAVADALDTDVTTDDGLIEMDFGDWEGKTFTEVRAEYPEQHKSFFFDANSCTPDGECMEDVYQRIQGVMDRLTRDYAGQNVVLVSHVTPIKAILRYALGVDATMFRTLHLDLAGLSIVEFYGEGKTVVRRVNDTHYLEG